MLLCSQKLATSSHRFIGGVSQAATQWSHLCVGTPTKMTTDPTKLLSEGVALAKRTWADANEKLGLTVQNVTEFALHQVGRANHDAVIQALGIMPNKALRVYIDNGNVGPVGFHRSVLVEQGQFKWSTRCMMGIGSGLNR